jgi:COMPASS component BRE2
VREQREKKESLKKREASASARGNTPDVKGKKQKGPTVPSPMRYSIPEPRPSDYEPPKDPILLSHEPTPIYTPDGEVELKKPIDQ